MSALLAQSRCPHRQQPGSAEPALLSPQELLPRQGGGDAAGQRGDAHLGGGRRDRQRLQR